MGYRSAHRWLSGIIGIALLVGACGPSDDDDGEGVAITDQPTESTVAPADEPPPEPDDTEDSGVSNAAATDSPAEDGQDSEPAAGAWCGVLDETDEVDMVFDALPSSTPAEVEAGLGRVDEVLQLIIGAAPPAIQAPVGVVVADAELITEALREANWSFLDIDLKALTNAASPEASDAAHWALDVYSNEECGRPFGNQSRDPADGTGVPIDDGSEIVEGTLREQAVALLLESGFTQEEAECILENIDITDPAALSDQATLTKLLEECDIDLDRFTDLAGG